MSSLARVEVPAAIWRKHRVGELSQDDAAVLLQAFDWDWAGGGKDQRFAIVRMTDPVVESAVRMLARHALRSLDALQLASALAAQAVDPELTDFVCFDEALAAAARTEGLKLMV